MITVSSTRSCTNILAGATELANSMRTRLAKTKNAAIGLRCVSNLAILSDIGISG